MKYYISLFILVILFSACSKSPDVVFTNMPNTLLEESPVNELPNWNDEDYAKALSSFINSCKTKKSQKIYADLCTKAEDTVDPKLFFTQEFKAYKIISDDEENLGLLTGYYEASLKGSLTKKDPYLYPVYEQPEDLIEVDLSSIYPELKNYRLRGRVNGSKLVPYYIRSETNDKPLDAKIICYVDSKIDLFFLEVQGSGRVMLDNGEEIYLGFANQNGHRYRSIGRYLVNKGEIELKDVSLQTIKAWLLKNPSRVDEVLNYNKSMVFFKKSKTAASGSLGLELTPNRSIAVDRRYIPLGTMLYLNSKIDEKNISRLVIAQDTGGAIKGAVRADMFLGFGDEAMNTAGKLKSELKLWVFMPKNN